MTKEIMKSPTITELEKIIEERKLPIDILPNGEIRVREDPKIFTIGDYTINIYADGTYWIYHKSGEGMKVSGEMLEKMLKNFYEENF